MHDKKEPFEIWQADEVAKTICRRFVDEGFPPTVIFSGESSPAKNTFILQVVSAALQKSARQQDIAWQHIYSLLQSQQESAVEEKEKNKKSGEFKKEHPDFIYFPASVKIGDPSAPEVGTIRYLLQHILLRFPLWGKARFIFFADASLIQDAAESALLKSLEEPRAENHFILVVDDAEKLKDTIRSRSIEIPFRQKITLENTPPDPWQRFWFFSGWQGSAFYNLLEKENFFTVIQEFYAELKRSRHDFDFFDDFFTRFKKTFKDESADYQTTLLRLVFLPFYFSCRDLLLEGVVPTMGPLRFPKGNIRNLLKVVSVSEDFFSNLSRRSFGNIPGNMGLIYFHFLDELMPHWIL